MGWCAPHVSSRLRRRLRPPAPERSRRPREHTCGSAPKVTDPSRPLRDALRTRPSPGRVSHALQTTPGVQM
jgi:hypothetical protein